MSLNDRLSRLEQFSHEIQRAASQRSPDALEKILDLREEFNGECVGILQDMCSEPRIFHNREVFDAMQGALETLRTRIISHQLRWTADRIESDPNGYFAAAQPMQDLLREFVTNARVFIRD